MKRRFTRVLRGLAALVIMVLSWAALAEESEPASPLEGIWKWTFTMPDGGQVAPRLKLKREGDKLIGTTRFRAGSETPITNLTVNGQEVSFRVVREREGRSIVTDYSGTLNGEMIKGKIVSNWSGEEQSYDWEAKRLREAEGTWKWTNSFGEFKVESTLKLKQEGEKVTGKISSRRVRDTEIKNGKFTDGEISFEIERDRDGEKLISRYYGRISGDKIQGKMELNFFGRPRTNDWHAIRVE